MSGRDGVKRLDIPSAMPVAAALGVGPEVAIELLLSMSAGLRDAEKELEDVES